MSSAAVGAKTERACDYCIRKRARWYCAADDAFLCQACDGSVHSANPLALRHERVRLNTASLKCSSDERACLPSWHRRARTPRHRKQPLKPDGCYHPSTVPELVRSTTTTTTTTTTSRDDDHEDDDQMQLLYRVPILDPYVAELCSSTATSNELTELIFLDDSSHEGFPRLDLNLDMDMAEFAADVETLLGKGLDGETFRIEEMGLLVKPEEEEMMPNAPEMEVIEEPSELTFDYNSPASCEEVDVKIATDEKREWRMSLHLDYDAISAAWASQGSPWMNGERPQINPNDCWLHGTMGGASTVPAFGGVGRIAGQGPRGDGGGREARVSRYREKRRTRLFSKKIRYEVRKLNAEKRPRMKGRFVKRSSFNPTPTPFPLLGK